MIDIPLTLSHAVNMAGLIQATAHWLLTERPFKHQEKDYLLYKFNRYQACRYGRLEKASLPIRTLAIVDR